MFKANLVLRKIKILLGNPSQRRIQQKIHKAIDIIASDLTIQMIG